MVWPHVLLGGASRQRLNYDQLSITHWVQGFCRNVLDEKCNKRREVMISYLSDIMEDATDFSWSSAKASHAVLLCEMERGCLTGKIWIESTESGWCMHKNMLVTTKHPGKRMRANNAPGSISSIRTVHVNSRLITRLVEKSTSICVIIALPLVNSITQKKDCMYKRQTWPKNEQPTAHQYDEAALC